MGLSITAAENKINELLSLGLSGDELKSRLVSEVLEKLDVSASGSKTILYGGMDNKVIDNLAKDANNRMLNNTAAYQFLKDPITKEPNAKLLEALKEIYGSDINPADPNFRNTPAGQFIGGIDGNPRTEGAWDTISKNFASKITGDVVIYAGEGAKTDRVLFSTEIEALRNNPEVKTINGVEKSNFFNQFDAHVSANDKLNALKVDTIIRTAVSNGEDAIHAVSLTEVDMNSHISTHPETSTKIQQSINELHWDDKLASSKAFNKLGIVGEAIGLMLALSSAAEAYEGGDKEGAKEILISWGIDEAGSTVGAVAGGILGSVLLGALGLTTATIGAIPIAVLLLGASIVGGMIGSDLFQNIYKEYMGNSNENSGHPTDYNPFTPQMSDPLVIDADKDGFISTVALEDSEVYFDLTGNGVKTRTSWVKGNDAILVYDENEDGQIGGISEVFGNATTSGFDELRDTIDSNHDNKIDRRDILFNRLQLWHDYDQDGVVDVGELKSLKDIATIDLNSVQTTIDLEGTILTEASHYTDTSGNKELAADLELQYMPKVDSTISAGNAGSIDVDTIFLPQLRGYGYVANSLLSYNSDASLKELATKYANNIDLVANHFDEFLATWAGFYTMAEGKGITKDEFSSNVLDVPSIRVWILEHFSGNTVDSWRTEAHLAENTNGGYHTTSYADEAYIDEKFNELVSRYEGIFALQAFYQDKLSGLSYDLATDEFVIADQSAFNTSFVNYMNDASVSTNYKIYLAKTINNLEDIFIHDDLDGSLSAITDQSLQTMISGILNGSENSTYYLFDKSNITTSENITVVGDATSETIKVESNGHASTIIGQKGNDKITTLNSNDTYKFSRGDGADMIFDTNGADKIVFGSGISTNDIVFTSKGNDLIVALFQDGVATGDQITILDFNKQNNRIETIVLADGSQIALDSSSILSLFTTEGNDFIETGSANDTINALGGDDTISTQDGNDTLIGGLGNDTLKGGKGNDTYIFNKGDGKDTIEDISGVDTLQFTEGVSANDIIAKIIGQDLVIALKVEGKSFEELSDTITVKGYVTGNKIESILLQDGTSIGLDTLLVGTSADDVLYFGDESTVINALGGNDMVTTGSGNDIIDGGEGNDTISSKGGNDVIDGGSGNDIIDAGDGANVVDGGVGNDIINAGSGNDTLMGGSGNDIIVAGSGADFITGGLGDDTLQGGLGNDTYIFNKGDGKDTIDDAYRYGYNNQLSQYSGEDTLKFGEGITKDDLVVLSVGNDVIIGIKEDGKSFEELSDKITLKNYTDSNTRVENILFSDGSKFLVSDLFSATEGADQLIYGDAAINVDALGGNDTIISGNGNDVIAGDEGNDTITSNSGNDTLSGGAGDDTLYAGSGDDTLSGGSGVDDLQGGLGSDTYLFGKGDGKDSIYDDYRYSGSYQGNAGLDTLKFAEGITKDDLVIRINGNDLIIGIKEEGKNFEALSDTITIKEYFNANNRIEKLELSDGTFVSLEELQQGTDGDDVLVFNDESTTINALGGNDKITTGAGNDVIDGGVGNDTIYSNAGNDIITAGSGNDSVYAGSGDDKLYGNEGDDLLDAGSGNDTLIGGTGADTLYGGAGNDLYMYTKGDGKDILSDESGEDTLHFSEGITKDDLIAKANGNDLIIGIKEEGKTFDQLTDTITIKNYLTSGKLEHLLLNDGTALALDELQQGSEANDYLVYSNEASTVNGLGGNDIIITGSGNDVIDGGSGNDTITSGGGADKIIGGLGDDVINAEIGEDTLTGSIGNDSLYGGLGNDTYIFNKGDGQDTIYDIEGNDVLKFGEGITKDDITVQRNGSDLIIALKESGKIFDALSDKIIITNWFNDQNNIEAIQFSDNTVWSKSEIAGMFVDATLPGVLYSKPGATMRGGSGDDTYVYNKGDFTVVIDDSYLQDNIEVQAGNDTLRLSGGINKEDVIFGIHNNDLILKFKSDQDTYEQLRDYVVIKDWKNGNNGIEKIIFSDGEILNITKNEAFEVTTFDDTWTTSRYFIYGDDKNVVAGTTADETFETNGGNDTINAGAGNDRIYAGDGNDTIEGSAGNDIISAGTGDDKISDESGDDTYLYNRGDGKDTLFDFNGNDTIILGQGITKEDLSIQQNGSDLVIGILENGIVLEELHDTLTINNWFNFNNQHVQIQLSDGEIISNEVINSIYNPPALIENFESNIQGWSNTTTTSNTELSRFLGRFGGTGGNESVSKTYDFGVKNAGKQVTIEFDMYEIDSWDGEAFKVFVNGTEKYQANYFVDDYYTQSDSGMKTSQNLFDGWGVEEVHHYSIEVGLDELGQVKLGFGSTLVEGINNESWGIDNIAIYSNTIDPLILNESSSESSTPNYAMYFDGNDAIRYDKPILANIANNFTFSIDITQNNFNGYQEYISEYGSTNTGDEFYVGTCSNYLRVGDSWQNALTLSSYITLGKAFNLTIVSTSDNAYVYIDGVKVATKGSALSITGSNDTFTIGRQGDGNSEYFYGSISDIQIYDRALNTEEISTIAKSTEVIQTGNLIAHFDFDINHPTTDITGNQADGTIIGNPLVVADTTVVNNNYTPPIVLDLNGNLTTSITLESSNVYFDYDGDGVKEKTAWIESGDALLSMDLNGDGLINNGSELFGNYTKLADGSLASDGYTALAQYDSNHDNVIDANDSAFASIKIWKDLNQNGITDAGELTSLQLSNISSIHLSREDGTTFSQITEAGNIISNQTSFTSSSTTSGIVRDVWFKVDQNDTITNNDTFISTVANESFSGGEGNDTYVMKLGGGKDTIDDNDATGLGVDTIRFASGISADQILVKWDRKTNGLIIGIRENSDDDTALKDLSDQIVVKNWFDATGKIEKFVFADGTVLDAQAIYAKLIQTKENGELSATVLASGDSLIGGRYNDVLFGAEGNELISGSDGDDYISGQAGDDQLMGDDGDDVLDGGLGSDILMGGNGDDYYIFEKSSGHDLISDSAGIDTLMLGAGITREDILAKVVGDDIILGVKETGKSFEELSDTITIKNWTQTGFEIENVMLDDGTILSLDDLRNQAPILTDTEVSIAMQDLRQSTGTIAVTDPDSDTLSYSISTQTTHGTLSVDENGAWIYKANAGYIGEDSAIIKVDDGNGGVVEQTLNFTLAVSAPSINTTELTLDEDTSLESILNVNNPVGGSLTYEVLNATTHGDFILNTDGSYSYNPLANYNGEDSVTVKVTNEYGLSTTQVIDLAITSVNDAPELTSDTMTLTLQDIRNANGQIQASDIENDTLTYSVGTQAAHGALSIDENGAWVYKANDGYIGNDSAIIKVDDGNGGVVEQTLNFDLKVSAPAINTTALTLLEDNSYSNTLAVTNPIGGTLTYAILDATDYGSFVLNSDGTYNYTPSLNYNGSDSLTLKVTNEYGLSSTQTIELNITPVNDTPTFVSSEDESYLLKNTRLVTGAINASDIDGDTLSYALSTNPTHGTLTLDATTGVWSYESLFGYIGKDSATISVRDGKGGMITKNITFNAQGLVYEGGDITISAQTIGDTLDLGTNGMDALSFDKSGNNLTITVKDQGVITISDYFTQPNQTLTTLSTAWGEINIDKEAIKQAGGTWWWPFGSATASNGVDSLLIGSTYSDTLTGASGNDILFGSSNNDKLIGNAGNDLLIAGSGNDTLTGSSGQDALYGDSGNDTLDAKEGDDYLIGGSGNDTLYGGSGADKLSGGVGNDTLYGDIGNDAYYFNLGDGKDTITDTSFSFCSWNTPEGGDDTIVFGEGIEKEDVTFLMQCGNLSIKYGDKESVVISGQSNDASAIERFELSDGSYLSSNDVESIIQQMSAYAKDHGIYISSNSSIENNQALMQIVSSGWHNA
jgi:Ca2+-binding RTX toxin-like protein